MRVHTIVLVLLVIPSLAAAQRPGTLNPQPSILFSAQSAPSGTLPFETTAAVPNAPHPSYWKEGAVAGGVVVGLFGAYLGAGLCGLSEEPGHSCTGSVLGGALLGALVGGTVGALIGGQFPR